MTASSWLLISCAIDFASLPTKANFSCFHVSSACLRALMSSVSAKNQLARPSTSRQGMKLASKDRLPSRPANSVSKLTRSPRNARVRYSAVFLY